MPRRISQTIPKDVWVDARSKDMDRRNDTQHSSSSCTGNNKTPIDDVHMAEKQRKKGVVRNISQTTGITHMLGKEG